MSDNDMQEEMSRMKQKLEELQEQKQRRQAFEEAYQEQLDDIMPLIEDVLQDFVEFHNSLVEDHDCSKDDCEVEQHPEDVLRQEMLGAMLSDIASEVFEYKAQTRAVLATAQHKYRKANISNPQQQLQMSQMEMMGNSESTPKGEPGDYIG